MTDSPKVAVLLSGYGEVEDYTEFADYNERALRLLASKFIKFPDFTIPWLAKGLEFTDRREWSGQDSYHSPHNQIFEAQRAGLEQVLQDRHGDRVAVYKAFNFCEPHLPAQVLQQIREDGYHRILLFPLLVVDSIFTGGLALQQVNEALGDDSQWVNSLRYFPSFFDRADYHQRVADHIEHRLSDLHGDYAPSQIGIILLNHGCPLDSKGYESGVRDSELLFYGVRDRLIHKYPAISIGWMNHATPGKWTTPDMEQAATNLLTLGVRALVFAPIGFATENHETMLDVGYTINKFKQRAECLHLDCLNEDPGFLRMAADWIDPLLGDMMGQPEGDRPVQPLDSSDPSTTSPLPNRNQHIHEHLVSAGHSHHGHHHHHGHSHSHRH